MPHSVCNVITGAISHK